MFGQKLGQEIGIQTADILKSVGRRKLRRNSKIKRRPTKRKIKIEQQSILVRLLRQQNGEVARNRADTRTALGARE
jgi:hypothetical protein